MVEINGTQHITLFNAGAIRSRSGIDHFRNKPSAAVHPMCSIGEHRVCRLGKEVCNAQTEDHDREKQHTNLETLLVASMHGCIQGGTLRNLVSKLCTNAFKKTYVIKLFILNNLAILYNNLDARSIQII